ncbi:MAG TPA: cupin domain-containing protein [Conexibacter sp.]|nr:cupin domain-containing protein [Conexibacter sp.]
MPKLVITGVDAQGRSCVASCEQLPDANPFNRSSFTADPAATDAALGWVDPADAAAIYEPPPGRSWTVIAQIDPHEQDVRQRTEAPVPGLDERGFHVTRTLDYVYVIDGPLLLDLEAETIDVSPGDVVIQQATRHAWRNLGDHPVRMFTVMVSLEAG